MLTCQRNIFALCWCTFFEWTGCLGDKIWSDWTGWTDSHPSYKWNCHVSILF